MRTTLLGSLLDVAAPQPRPRRRAGRAVRVRPRLPDPADGPIATGPSRPSTRWRATSRGARGAVHASRTGSAPSRSAPLVAASWRGRRRAGRLLRAQGRARRRSPASSAPRLAFDAGRRAVPAPRPRRRGSRSPASPRAGSASSTRWSAAPGTSTPRSASRSTSRRCSPPPAPARRPTRTSPASRPSTRTSPSSSPAETAAAEVARGGPRRRRRAAALGRGLRPLRGRAARRGAQEPGAAARVPAPPTAPSTDEEVAGLRAAIEAALEEIGGSLRG